MLRAAGSAVQEPMAAARWAWGRFSPARRKRGDLVSGSVVAEVPRNVALDLHRVVENATDADQIWTDESVKQEVSRTENDPVLGSCVLTAVPQMIAANILAELWPKQASNPFRFSRDIAHVSSQKPLVAKTTDLAEIRFGVGEQVNDISQSSPSKAVDRHMLFAGTADPVTCLSSQLADDPFQIVSGDIVEATFVDLPKSGSGRILKCCELRSFQRVALLDQPDPVTQNLTGILIATGLDEPVDDFLVVIRQDDVPCRHQGLLRSC